MTTFTVRRTTVALLGALTAGLMLPAAANAEPRVPADTPAEMSGMPVRTTRAPSDKICTKIQLTGSRIDKKVCRTASEWKAEGAEIVAR